MPATLGMLNALRRTCTVAPAASRERFTSGAPAVDDVLGGGLARGGLHEVLATGADAPAAAGFVAGLMLRAAPSGRPMVWVRRPSPRSRSAASMRRAWPRFGVDPDELILVGAHDAVGALRAGVEAVRCAALGAVVIETWGAPKALDLTATRRLALASERSGVTTFLLRVGAGTPSAARRAGRSRRGRRRRSPPGRPAHRPSTSCCCATAPASPERAGAWSGTVTDASSVNRRRYLALWFPFLPADRLHRSGISPGQDETPLVLFETAANALRVVAVDRRALTLGLTPGLTLADARARVPTLDAVEMDRRADAALLDRLADVCDRYTPLVALDAPDGLILDITGCAHLFAGEERLRDDLMQRCQRAGIAVSASIAGTPDAARALARFGGTEIVPAGQEGSAVCGLPVAALALSAEAVTALARAGLKTVGDLMARPRAPLAARFGADMADRLDRATGRQDIGITPRRPLPACLVERHAAEPIADIDTILAILTGLAGEAVRMLEGRGEGGRAFEAAFLRTDGAVRRITVETGRPLRDAQALMRLFRERLDSLEDALDPGFGFDVIRLAVALSEALAPAQASLDGRLVEEEEVADLIDRLGARFGAEAVRRLMPRDTHIPERSARTLPAAAAEANGGEWQAPDPGMPPARPLYLFGRPQPIETLAEVPDGPPLRFRWRRVLHEVARAEGPERIAPEWWRDADDALTRDYYRVEDSLGRRFWVFREGQYGAAGLSPRWFIHGTFA